MQPVQETMSLLNKTGAIYFVPSRHYAGLSFRRNAGRKVRATQSSKPCENGGLLRGKHRKCHRKLPPLSVQMLKVRVKMRGKSSQRITAMLFGGKPFGLQGQISPAPLLVTKAEERLVQRWSRETGTEGRTGRLLRKMTGAEQSLFRHRTRLTGMMNIVPLHEKL